MGGGNGQKSATSRARNQAKADAEKGGGGGKEGMKSRQAAMDLKCSPPLFGADIGLREGRFGLLSGSKTYEKQRRRAPSPRPNRVSVRSSCPRFSVHADLPEHASEDGTGRVLEAVSAHFERFRVVLQTFSILFGSESG